MKDNFEKCLGVTLVQEGGWSDNPHDPGGATMKGMTQRVYDAYRKSQGLSKQSVRYISTAELDSIYGGQFWGVVKGDELPIGVDMVVFDCAVNSGTHEAIVLLQQAVGAKADGNLGLISLGLVKAEPEQYLIPKFSSARLGFMHRLRTWRFFDRGWTARVKYVQAKAMEMAK